MAVVNNNLKSLLFTAAPPLLSADSRGLFADFYAHQMKPKTVATASSTTVMLEGDDEVAQDLGEKFTHSVVKTAVALADTGIQTAQDILKTMGSEIIEAIKN